jgi:hypothetical protein
MTCYKSWKRRLCEEMNQAMKVAGMVLLSIGTASVCSAVAAAAPEIDPSSGANALAMLTGALLIIRGRRR